MGALPELLIAIANHNKLRYVPPELANLPKLISLTLSNNPDLTTLPAEIAEVPSLGKLLAAACGFSAYPESSYSLAHDPPSLLETCARILVDQPQQHTLLTRLPLKFQRYLMTARTCSFCRGPYFDSYVRRTRCIERNPGQPITIEYRSCRAH